MRVDKSYLLLPEVKAVRWYHRRRRILLTCQFLRRDVPRVSRQEPGLSLGRREISRAGGQGAGSIG